MTLEERASGRVERYGRWLLLAGLGLALSSAATAAAQVAVVTRAPADHEVAAQLGYLTEVSVREHALPEARTLAGVLHDAAEWPDAYVVVVDRPVDTVHVLRPRDHTVVSRVLDPGVMQDSQYAVALATAELLEWMGVLPAARGRPSQASDASAVGADGLRGEGRSAFGWAAGLDLELATSPGFDVSVVRPSLHVAVQYERARAPLWLELGARLAGPASWEHSLDAARFVSDAAQLEYSNTQVALHAALGFGAARATLLAELEAGASIVQVEARSSSGSRVGEHDAVSPWLGVGLGLRYPVISGLGVAAAVQGQWLLDRERYRIEGSPVLDEGPIRVATRVGLIWESALLP